MSVADLPSDVEVYLKNQGHIDGYTWKSYLGQADKIKDAHDRMVIITMLPGGAPNTHDDQTREPAFKILIRGPRHGFNEAMTKWNEIVNALDGQHEALNSDANTQGTYYHINSDSASPVEDFADRKDRPMLTADFSVTMAKA